MHRRRAFQVLLVLAAAGGAIWLARAGGATAEGLVRRAPRRPWAAAAFLLALYALKGLSFFFPLAVLEAAGGLLFPLPGALALNAAGLVLATLPPYLLGRRDRGALDGLLRRHPRLEAVRRVRQGGGFPFVLLLRLAGVVPCDAVSLCLGAAGLPWRTYLCAGTLGMLPHMAAATALGASAARPGSGGFFTAAALSAAVTVLSLALWRIRARRGAP
jgi:uncharacterized membrane protein YdjX (TVP38/TMEM64 family)